jgi:hypothetical protein
MKSVLALSNYHRNRLALTAIEVGRLSREWVDGPKVHVVATAQDLPVVVSSDARGLYHRNQVYVVADQPQSMVAQTLAHEALAHFAMRDLFGRPLWRRFALAVRSGARRGSDAFLRHLRVRVETVYRDGQGRRQLTPRQLGDEIAAALAEECFDRRTGRLLVHDPLLAEAEAAIGLVAREVLRVDYEVTHRQLQGALLLAEHRLRYGSLFWGVPYRAKRACLAACAIAAGLVAWLALLPV